MRYFNYKFYQYIFSITPRLIIEIILFFMPAKIN